MQGSTHKTCPCMMFCMIYTHSNEHHRVKAIVNTWGRGECYGFFVASNTTDLLLLSINAINLTNEGPEELRV